MQNLFTWAITALCSVLIFYDFSVVYSSIFQGIMMLVINSQLRLSTSQGEIYIIGLFFELLLSILSCLVYLKRPIYSVIFWIYFSSINKFAVEDPMIFSVYGKYSVYLGYSCSSVLFGIYSQVNNEVLFRYGSLWIFINMSIIGFTWIYKFRMQGADLLRLGIICIVCFSSAISMIDNCAYIILPGAVGSLAFLLYESFYCLIRIRRND